MRLILQVAFFVVLNGCALLDGYKDNVHAQFASTLTPKEKRDLQSGLRIRKQIHSDGTQGEFIAMKGNTKYGEFNFVEIGFWKETYEISISDFKKGAAVDEIRYDSLGNIIERVVKQSGKHDNSFYTIEEWKADFRIFGKDTVLIQNIKGYNENNILLSEHNQVVVNYKEMLSDRLKNKVYVGRVVVYDKNGKLKSETFHKYKNIEI